MKKLLLPLALVSCLGLLTACHSIKYGQWSVTSFGQKVQFEEMSVDTNGAVHIKGYNLDQVTLPLATLQALSAAAAKGAMVP